MRLFVIGCVLLCVISMGTAYGEEGKVVPQDVTRVDSLSALLKVAVSGDGESQDALVSTLTNEVLTRAQ